ncbi:related to CDC28 - cyclin-dependent protein kinase [Melanopsichium pennsylvanicum]|uniref:Related to CDC28 - cyclin-dependent protein kinase n=2 Tax=Melanopsichium pennsylvanicum TaxID=63383 RepID=A0AAJ5C4Y5_9BASI|nr:related to CDC28-cyclin-dependent protein kinase [Melanopsichium pennsylvanicum 4]SNX84167.1 related to CDC28 - cyclin-dependent protein kinase [Melanopsichium pennsylvanicum]
MTDQDGRAPPGASNQSDGAASSGLSRERALRERLAATREERSDTSNQPVSKRQKLEDSEERSHNGVKEDATAAGVPANESPISSHQATLIQELELSQHPGSPRQGKSEPLRRASTWSALRRSAHPPIAPSRSIYSYERLNHIQEGTYGVVFRAHPRDPSPPSNESWTSTISALSSSRDVAVKKLKLSKNGLDNTGFPITSLREIQALTLAKQHSYVIRLHEVCIGKTLDQIFLVMEFMEHDLKTLLTSFHKARKCFAPSEVKTVMHQLLTATKDLHQDWIVHRDLKSSNLLMDNRGRLKLADFGLARRFGDPISGWTPATQPRQSDDRAGGDRNGDGGIDVHGSGDASYEDQVGEGMTDLVVTLWYRAPELLLLNQIHQEREERRNKARNYASSKRSASIDDTSSNTLIESPSLPLYNEKIDMWSIGCIFAELLLTSKTGGGLFSGKDEYDQLRRIRRVLGPANTVIWPDLPLFSSPPGSSAPLSSSSAVRREEKKIKDRLEDKFLPTRLTPATLDLLFRLLHYDPKQRISAREALEHEFFRKEPPKMAHPDSFGSFPSVAAGQKIPYDTPSAPPKGRAQDHRSQKRSDNKKGGEYPLEFDFDL